MTERTYSISKTSFIKFEQCQKAFFLYKNHPYLRDKFSLDKQLTFKRGHDVGFYAQQLFPGGIDVSKETKNTAQALELTETLLKNNCPVIYEATFLFKGVLIMIDILCLENGNYTAYEVKSSLKVSEVYLKDAYLQYYVIKNVLPTLQDLFLVSLNADYRLENETEPKLLFKRRSTRQKAEENFQYFEHRIKEAHNLLEQNSIPNIAIGKHCFRPYQCDFFGSCWKDTQNEKSIFNLPLADKNSLFDWYNSGIKNLDELSDELLEKPNLIALKNAITTNQVICNKAKITEFIASLSTPMVAMDMEIWNPAIPQLKGTGPFQQIPFLVSFYDGNNYFHFFTGHITDEREEFARQLIALSAGFTCIVVYDKTMEFGVIDALIKSYPLLKAELEALKLKFRDVFDLVLNNYYYDPSFKNNFTLKGVSSALLENVNYAGIGSGLEAMNYYDQYRLETKEPEKENLKQKLVDYCNTDCYATYGLVEFFRKLIGN